MQMGSQKNKMSRLPAQERRTTRALTGRGQGSMRQMPPETAIPPRTTRSRQNKTTGQQSLRATAAAVAWDVGAEQREIHDSVVEGRLLEMLGRLWSPRESVRKGMRSLESMEGWEMWKRGVWDEV